MVNQDIQAKLKNSNSFLLHICASNDTVSSAFQVLYDKNLTSNHIRNLNKNKLI